MKLFTMKQKLWFFEKTIRVGETVMFPRFGFTVYTAPNFESGYSLDTNPFTKSLDNESFLVKDNLNGFYKGNFERRPKGADFYIHESELKRRDFIEVILLFSITCIPLIIYNLFVKEKNENN